MTTPSSIATLNKEYEAPLSEIVTATARTFLASIPGCGGIVQGHTELEGIRNRRRMEELFDAFSEQQRRHAETIARLEDFKGDRDQLMALIEKSVRSALAESDAEKRRAHGILLSNAIQASGTVGFEDKLDAIAALDTLHARDIKALRHFAVRPTRIADIVDSNANPMWEPDDMAEPVGALAQSVAKLIARGLISEAEARGAFQTNGPEGHWVNVWRRKAYVAMPMGKLLVKLLEQ